MRKSDKKLIGRLTGADIVEAISIIIGVILAIILVFYLSSRGY